MGNRGGEGGVVCEGVRDEERGWGRRRGMGERGAMCSQTHTHTRHTYTDLRGASTDGAGDVQSPREGRAELPLRCAFDCVSRCILHACSRVHKAKDRLGMATKGNSFLYVHTCTTKAPAHGNSGS